MHYYHVRLSHNQSLRIAENFMECTIINANNTATGRAQRRGGGGGGSYRTNQGALKP